MDNIEQQANLYVGQQSVDYGDSNERAEQQIKEAFIAGARGYLGTLNPNNLGEKKVFKPTTVEDLSCEKLENPFLHEQPFAQEDLERDLGLLYPPQPDKPFTPHEPTIDEMIDQMEDIIVHIEDVGQLWTRWGIDNRNHDTIFRAVVKTLTKLKPFTINIALEQVINDLMQVIADAGLNRDNGSIIKPMLNAGAALTMIKAFKENPITARDVAEAHQAGKNILDKKEIDAFFKLSKEERKQVYEDTGEIIVSMMEKLKGHETDPLFIAMAIFQGIKAYDKLKSKAE